MEAKQNENESHPLKQDDHPLKNKAHQLKETTDSEQIKLKKINNKYGSVSKNFVTGETSITKDTSKMNIGHMSMEQLSDQDGQD